MNIPMPTEAEKKKSIEYIRKNGMKKRKNIFGIVAELYRNVGLKNIFFGVYDCIVLSLVAVTSAFFLTYAAQAVVFNDLVLLTAPAFFLTACFLTSWKDYVSGTSEQKAVCKYKTSHITAFRMLVFSIIGVLLDIPFCIALSRFLQTEFFKILLLSLSAMFLYSLIMTVTVLTVRHKFAEYAVPAVWISVNIAICFNEKIKWFAVFSELNMAVSLICCIVFIIFYLIALNLLVTKGERKYADS